MPMSATSTSPAWKRPGATTSPTFGACIVTVTSAATAAPAISPVEASTPDGTSTATIGTGDALMRSIVSAASSRGAPWKPVPNSASMTTSAPSSSSLVSRPASASTRNAMRPSPPFAPLPQTAAIRCASGYRRSTASATARPACSIIVSTSWPCSAARISSAV
jgi:hypothetical protein